MKKSIALLILVFFIILMNVGATDLYENFNVNININTNQCVNKTLNPSNTNWLLYSDYINTYNFTALNQWWCGVLPSKGQPNTPGIAWNTTNTDKLYGNSPSYGYNYLVTKTNSLIMTNNTRINFRCNSTAASNRDSITFANSDFTKGVVILLNINNNQCERNVIGQYSHNDTLYCCTLKRLTGDVCPFNQPDANKNFSVNDIFTACTFSQANFSDIDIIEIAKDQVSGRLYFDNLNMSDMIDLNNNSLPSFNATYTKNVCLNSTTNTNNFNISYNCADPEGDTCYYSLSQQTVFDVIFNQNLDGGGGFIVYTGVKPADVPTYLGWFYDLGDWAWSVINPSGIFNQFSEPNYDIDNYLNTTCLRTLSPSNEYPYQQNMMWNNRCADPLYITFPAQSYVTLGNQYDISFLLENLTQQGLGDYSESIIKYLDANGGKVVNFTITRNFTTRVTTIYLNGAVMTTNVTNADLYRLSVITNSSSGKYVIVLKEALGGQNEYRDLYRSPEYSISWQNIYKVQLWAFYGSSIAYDDIRIVGLKQSFAWTSDFPLNPGNISQSYIDYNIYVSDSVHKDIPSYNTYPVRVSMSSQFCGSGLYTDQSPPVTPEQRGSPQGFFFLLKSIYGIGNALGAQLYFNAVGWLFYLLLFIMMLWRTGFKIDVSLIVSSCAIFVLGVTGMLSVIYLVTSIILIALGLSIRQWMPSGGATE